MKFLFFGLLILASLQFINCKDCMDGWSPFEDSCYVHMKEAYTWFDAKTACEQVQAKVVELNSDAETDFVISLMMKTNSTWDWIGIEDILEEGTWVYASSQDPVGFTSWRDGEPNNYNGKEDCALMGIPDPKGKWVDVPCSEVHASFTCETR